MKNEDSVDQNSPLTTTHISTITSNNLISSEPTIIEHNIVTNNNTNNTLIIAPSPSIKDQEKLCKQTEDDSDNESWHSV
jgi:hypothetical protein